MDNPQTPELRPHDHLAKHVAGAFIASVRFVAHQLATADLNPHEGKLRSSVMPSENIEIPDYPPVHDDII